MSITCDSLKYHKTSRNLLEEYVLDCMYSPFTKITYILTSPPCLFGSVSQSYLRCFLLGCSPHFAPDILLCNLTCNSHIVLFFLIDSFMATKKKGLGVGFSLSPELYEELES